MAKHKSEPTVFHEPKQKPKLRFGSDDIKVGDSNIGDMHKMVIKGKMVGMNQNYSDKKKTDYEMEVMDMKPMKDAMVFHEKKKEMMPEKDMMMNEEPKPKKKKKRKKGKK